MSYVEGSWDSTTKKLTYTLHDGTSAANSTPVTHDTTTWNGGWHYVTGDVHLILCDGAKLTASRGITVTSNDTTLNKLTIYAQSGGTGKLVATAWDNTNAGIGGGPVMAGSEL